MLKTILAYVIVLALGQFAFTIGMLLGSGLFGAIFYYLPLRIKSVVAGTLAGMLAATAVIWFAYAVFMLLTAYFRLYPFLAAVISMLIPLNNDFRKYRERKQSMSEIDWQVDYIANEAKAMMLYEAATVIGPLLGIGLGAWYFLHSYS